MSWAVFLGGLIVSSVSLAGGLWWRVRGLRREVEFHTTAEKVWRDRCFEEKAILNEAGALLTVIGTVEGPFRRRAKEIADKVRGMR